MNALCHLTVTLLMFDGDVTHMISVFVCQVNAQVVSICVRISSEKKPLIRF